MSIEFLIRILSYCARDSGEQTSAGQQCLQFQSAGPCPLSWKPHTIHKARTHAHCARWRMDITTVVSLMVESAFHGLTFLSRLRPNYQQPARLLDHWRLVSLGLCVSTEPNHRPHCPIFGCDLVHSFYVLGSNWQRVDDYISLS